METIIDKSLRKLKWCSNPKKRSRIIEKRHYSSKTKKEEEKIPKEEILRIDSILRERVLQCWRGCEELYENLKPQLQDKWFRIEGQVIPRSDEEHIPEWEWLLSECDFSCPAAVFVYKNTVKDFQQTDLEKLGLFSEDDTYGSETFPGELRHTLPVCLAMKRMYDYCHLSLLDIVRFTGFDIKYTVEIENTIETD